MYIIFYSSFESGDLHAKVLKDYIHDGLIFCDIEKADIKSSKFSQKEIIICGSENLLIHWAKQWMQADTIQNDNIFYISVASLIALKNGKLTIDEAKEKITIDGYLDCDKCRFLRNGEEFFAGKRSLGSKLLRKSLLFKAAVKKTHGSASIVTDSGEKKDFVIPKPTHIQRKYDIQIVGLTVGWGGDSGAVAIQLHSDCRSLNASHHALMRYRTIQPSEAVTVVIGFNTWIIGGVSEIIAPRL